ncbi:membrane protein [Mycobacterium phage LilSpotty]|uniref:Membrane protein n=1 Tax=Mycobacterium phage LilSpotty TaxID=2588512 RepID=A0A4Y6EM33_9CAUD|nr:membrane protein [Mycobacterium phage LilSpotty]QDF19768.1 membrane protein [Mycobacterium phage LilSpotty]
MRAVYGIGTLALLAVLASDLWLDIEYGPAANWSLTLVTAMLVAFTVLYGVRSNWKSNRIGRVVFTKCVFLSLVLIQGTVSAWGGSDYPYRDVIRFVIYAFGAIAYAPMLITLLLQQQQDRRERR